MSDEAAKKDKLSYIVQKAKRLGPKDIAIIVLVVALVVVFATSRGCALPTFNNHDQVTKAVISAAQVQNSEVSEKNSEPANEDSWTTEKCTKHDNCEVTYGMILLVNKSGNRVLLHVGNESANAPSFEYHSSDGSVTFSVAK